ncbi:CheF family chemotaxis protein [Halobaculum rubrum]|uniref:CheF family chemotaxis protein n=1 Tax=Halobaculum rubrum TaxID=2872158 RepID=UPI001CA40DAE|nr:CheF family chemotaxis protein [Halobaculum rubrum]QZY00722.1 CheF family chemotaxis protein [Halobaculum rubrum]
MSETVVADFVGRFFAPGIEGDPPTGRIILSRRRLVLAADGYKETIPLSSVFDVKVGQVPPEMAGYFNDTVTVAYRTDDTRGVAAIEGNDTNIDRFATVLFKVLLNGTKALVRHPAKVGGRVVETETHTARLDVTQGALSFEGCPEPFTVDLRGVVSVERSQRDLGNGTHPVISFRHIEGGTAVTSQVGMSSGRLTNILGRYIRLRYADVKEELEDVELGEEETEVLVAAYSAGPSVSLSKVVDIEPQRLTMLLNGLIDEELLVDTDEGTKLTAKGRVIVGQRIESVNT